jgi:Glycosyl hydrolase family 36 C-terminal domain
MGVKLPVPETLRPRNISSPKPCFTSPKLCFNRDRLSRQVAGCFFCLCAFDTEERGFPRLQLLGLDPKATYALGSIEGKAAEGTPAEASGAWWMNHGIEVALRGDF